MSLPFQHHGLGALQPISPVCMFVLLVAQSWLLPSVHGQALRYQGAFPALFLSLLLSVCPLPQNSAPGWAGVPAQRPGAQPVLQQDWEPSPPHLQGLAPVFGPVPGPALPLSRLRSPSQQA